MYSTRSPYIIVHQCNMNCGQTEWSAAKEATLARIAALTIPAKVFCSRIPIEIAIVIAITLALPESANALHNLVRGW